MAVSARHLVDRVQGNQIGAHLRVPSWADVREVLVLSPKCALIRIRFDGGSVRASATSSRSCTNDLG